MAKLHEQIAYLWHEICGRRDLGLIAQECLGSMWPLVVKGKSTADVDNNWTVAVIILKQLFSVQRKNLPTTPRHDPATYLSSNILLDALDCISRIAALVASVEEASRTRRSLLNILRVTFLSGFRVAMLRRVTEHSMGDRLVECVKCWPDRVSSESIDEKWTHALLQGSLDYFGQPEIGKTDLTTDTHQHKAFKAQDQFWHVFQYDLSPSVQAAAICINEQCPRWYHSAWVLLDAKYSLLTAYTESLLEGIPPQSTHQFTGQGEAEELRYVKEADARDLHDKWVILGKCATDESPSTSFFQGFMEFLSHVEPGPDLDLLRQEEWQCWCSPGPTRYFEPFAEEMCAIYERALHLLRARKSLVFDSGGIVQFVSTKLDNSIAAWLPQPSAPENIYILHCPDLHPIGYQQLMDLIEATPLKKGRLQLHALQDYVSVDVKCSFHRSPPPSVDGARRLKPLADVTKLLGEISKIAQETVLVSGRNDMSVLPADSLPPTPLENTGVTLSRATSETLGLDPESGISKKSDKITFGTAEIFTTITQATVSSSSSAKKSRSASLQQGSDHLVPQDQIHLAGALSPDATNLAVWSCSLMSCLSIENQVWSNNVHLEYIILGAVGKRTFAAVQKASDDCILSIYDAKTGNAVGNKTMKLSGQAYSIRYSNDGQKLAVGTRSKVRVISSSNEDWTTKGNYWDRVLLDDSRENNPVNVRRQSLSFSSDGSRLVVGTHFLEDHNHEESETRTLVLDVSPPGNRSATRRYKGYKLNVACHEHRDIGLSDVPCVLVNNTVKVMFCTSTSHALQPKILTFVESSANRNPVPAICISETLITGEKHQNNCVHTAISLPGPKQPRFLMMNENNKFFLVNGPTRTRLDWNLARGRISEADNKQKVQIAAENERIIAVFYISQGQGYLTFFDRSLSQQSLPRHISLGRFSQVE